MFFEPIVVHLIEGVVTSALGAVAAWWAAAHRKDRAMEHAMTAILRQQLISIHRQYIVAGRPVPYEVKEQAEDIYLAYAALGGNGNGKHMWEEIRDAHVGTPLLHQEETESI